MGVCRYVWNKTLGYINEHTLPINEETQKLCRERFITLTKRLRECHACHVKKQIKEVNFICGDCGSQNTKTKASNVINEDLQQWELEVPKDIRDRTQRDLFKAYKSSFALMKAGHIKKFKMQFRSKKSGHAAIEINKNDVHIKDNQLQLFKTLAISKEPIRLGRRQKVTNISSDARIVFDGLHFWLHYLDTSVIELKGGASGVVALDPGARKFQVMYSQDEVGSLGRDPKLLEKYTKKIDLLKSLRDKKKLKKSRCQRKVRQLGQRIRNIIDDMHIKIANYLCSHYDQILSSEFGVSKMFKNLASKTNRMLSMMSHYRFKIRLLWVSQKYRNCRVFIVNESYTSLTCNHNGCGFVNTKSTDKILTCRQCKVSVDRDCRGARGIYLKHVS